MPPDRKSTSKLPRVQIASKKNTCAGRLCDPTPEAFRISEEKARLRALDSRNPTNLIRAREYERHMVAIENASAVVDTKPPIVPKSHFHNFFKSNMSGLFQAKIDCSNSRLLARLAGIYSGHIKTGLDNRLQETTKSLHSKTYDRALKAVNLMHQNLRKFEALKQAKPTYSTLEMSKWYIKQRKHKDRIAKYPDISKPKACPLIHQRVMEKSLAKPRQFAYLLVEVEDKEAKNLVIELFADLCPFTVRNFQKLCTNTKATECDCRTYRCKKIDRLHCVQVVDGKFKKIYWVVAENVDSTVEYTQFMLKECSPISHSEAGLITRPKGRAGGVFFITIGPCHHLDNFCYVFGRLSGEGVEFLRKMEHKNIEENGQAIINMHITDCGVVNNEEDVPPPMLLQDFIQQVRHEIMPFIKRNPENGSEWIGGKSTFAEMLKERAADRLGKFDEMKKEVAELEPEEDDDDDE